MNKKKILIVTATFYPLNSPRSNRTTELAKELARQGHEVTVLTPKVNLYHLPFEEKYNVKIKHLGNRKWKSFAIKGKGLQLLFWRAMVRFPNLLFEYPDIELIGMIKKALKNEKDYDLMVSIAVPYPVHWGVAASRSKSHQIANLWVADCGDPYMGDVLDSFRKPFYFKYLEKNFCRKADFISVPTAGSIKGYYPEFHCKMIVIPQGFNFEETPIYTDVINNPVLTFAYAGGFIPGSRDPRELLNYLIQNPQPFKFIIYTNNTDIVEPYIAASRNRVELRSYIPRAQLIFEMSKMNFLVNFTNGTNLATPSKLIDYAITKRPILSIDTGKFSTNIVEAFLKGDYSKKFETGNMEKYQIKNVVNQFIALSAKCS